jgi:hypothetical protein
MMPEIGLLEHVCRWTDLVTFVLGTCAGEVKQLAETLLAPGARCSVFSLRGRTSPKGTDSH